MIEKIKHYSLIKIPYKTSILILKNQPTTVKELSAEKLAIWETCNAMKNAMIDAKQFFVVSELTSYY